MKTPEQNLIDDLGGQGVVAEALNLRPNRVGNWRKRGIPWQWRPAVKALAEKRKVKVPADFLSPREQAEAERTEHATQ